MEWRCPISLLQVCYNRTTRVLRWYFVGTQLALHCKALVLAILCIGTVQYRCCNCAAMVLHWYYTGAALECDLYCTGATKLSVQCQCTASAVPLQCQCDANLHPNRCPRASNATHTREAEDTSRAFRGNTKETWRSQDPAATFPRQCNSPKSWALPETKLVKAVGFMTRAGHEVSFCGAPQSRPSPMSERKSGRPQLPTSRRSRVTPRRPPLESSGTDPPGASQLVPLLPPVALTAVHLVDPRHAQGLGLGIVHGAPTALPVSVLLLALREVRRRRCAGLRPVGGRRARLRALAVRASLRPMKCRRARLRAVAVRGTAAEGRRRGARWSILDFSLPSKNRFYNASVYRFHESWMS